MNYYAKKDFDYEDVGGKQRKAVSGQEVEIKLRHEEMRLRKEGAICDIDIDGDPVEKNLNLVSPTASEILDKQMTEAKANKKNKKVKEEA